MLLCHHVIGNIPPQNYGFFDGEWIISKVNLIILYYIIRCKPSPVNQNEAGKWPIYVIFTAANRILLLLTETSQQANVVWR